MTHPTLEAEQPLLLLPVGGSPEEGATAEMRKMTDTVSKLAPRITFVMTRRFPYLTFFVVLACH